MEAAELCTRCEFAIPDGDSALAVDLAQVEGRREELDDASEVLRRLRDELLGLDLREEDRLSRDRDRAARDRAWFSSGLSGEANWCQKRT